MHVITEIDADTGALFARNAYNTEFAERVAFFDVDDATRTCDRRPRRIPRSQRHAAQSRRDGAAAAFRHAWAPHWIRARRSRCRSSWPTARSARSCSGSARRPATTRRASSCSAFADRRRARMRSTAVQRLLDAHARRRAGRDAGSGARRAGQRLAASTRSLSCRLWARSGVLPVGRRIRFPRSVAGRDGARPCRAAICCASNCCAARRVSSARATSSTGGIRRRGAACARIARTTICGCRSRRAATSQRPATPACSTSRCISSKAVARQADEESYYDLPTPSEEAASLYEHCVRAIEHGLRFGAHGLPLMGSGDWNDGMNLVGAGGKGESVWLGFFLYAVLTQFSELARRRDEPRSPTRCASEAARLRDSIEQHGWDGDWYRRAYFDDGSPLGSAATPSAGSIRLRRAGRCCPARAIRSARARRWMRSIGNSSAATRAGPVAGSAVRPIAIPIPATSGLRAAACARTAASTRTPRSGPRWRSSRSVTRERAWEIATMINPINHARTPDSSAVYKTEPYVIAADVYALAPHTGRGGWTWYTGSAGWMYRLIVESLLGLRLEGDKLRIAPCLPVDLDDVRAAVPLSRDGLPHHGHANGRRRQRAAGERGRCRCARATGCTSSTIGRTTASRSRCIVHAMQTSEMPDAGRHDRTRTDGVGDGAAARRRGPCVRRARCSRERHRRSAAARRHRCGDIGRPGRASSPSHASSG